MNFDWSSWDTGRKIIVIGFALALISFGLTWEASWPRASYTFSGFSKGWPLIGLAGLLVPLLAVLRGGPVKKMLGFIGAAFALAIGITFALTAVKEVSTGTRYLVQYGCYVYLLASAAVGVGVGMAE